MMGGTPPAFTTTRTGLQLVGTISAKSKVQHHYKTMNLEHSFTLCPPNSRSLTPPPPTLPPPEKRHGSVNDNNADNDGMDSQGGTCNSSVSSVRSLSPKSDGPARYLTSAAAGQPVMIPGTASLLLNWEKPSRNRQDQAPRAFRASPFEPLIHQRNLPKCGTITPLKMDEYYANQQQQQLHHYQNLGYYSTTTHRASTSPASDTSRPPVSEIRIPRAAVPSTSMDSNATIATMVPEPTDWQSLYLESQRCQQVVQDQADSMLKENRQLKRNMIELQRRLNALQHAGGRPNTAWVVPVGSESSRSVTSSSASNHQHDRKRQRQQKDVEPPMPSLNMR